MGDKAQRTKPQKLEERRDKSVLKLAFVVLLKFKQHFSVLRLQFIQIWTKLTPFTQSESLHVVPTSVHWFQFISVRQRD